MTTIAKAIAAAATAAGGGLAIALTEGGVSGGEIAGIILSAIAAGFATYATPNGSGEH